MPFSIWNFGFVTENFVQCPQSNQNSGDAPGAKELKGTQAPWIFEKFVNG